MTEDRSPRLIPHVNRSSLSRGTLTIPLPAAEPGASLQGIQVSRQLAEVCEGSRWQEVVHERQGGLESTRERFVALGADEGVEPDESVAASLQARDLFAQHLRIAAVPSVRDEEHDWLSVEHTP